jgi:hypothetical protein
MDLDDIPQFSYVKSGPIHGIFIGPDLESETLHILRVLNDKIALVSVSDFVAKFGQLVVLSHNARTMRDSNIIKDKLVPYIQYAKIYSRVSSTKYTELLRDLQMRGEENWIMDALYEWLSFMDILPVFVCILSLILILIVFPKSSLAIKLGLIIILIYVTLIQYRRICRFSVTEVTLPSGILRRNNKILLKDLHIGSHVVRPMKIGLVHHGIVTKIDSIDLDGIQVTHNSKDFTYIRPVDLILGQPETVISESLRKFLEDFDDLKLVEYPGLKSLEPKVILDRLHRSHSYWFCGIPKYGHNCETLVLYAKYGESWQNIPHQVSVYLIHSLVTLFLVVVICILSLNYLLYMDYQGLILPILYISAFVINFLYRPYDRLEREWVETSVQI